MELATAAAVDDDPKRAMVVHPDLTAAGSNKSAWGQRRGDGERRVKRRRGVRKRRREVEKLCLLWRSQASSAEHLFDKMFQWRGKLMYTKSGQPNTPIEKPD